MQTLLLTGQLHEVEECFAGDPPVFADLEGLDLAALAVVGDGAVVDLQEVCDLLGGQHEGKVCPFGLCGVCHGARSGVVNSGRILQETGLVKDARVVR